MIHTLQNLFGFMTQLQYAPGAILGNADRDASSESVTTWRSLGLHVRRNTDELGNQFFHWANTAEGLYYPRQGVAFMYAGRRGPLEVVFSTIENYDNGSYHLSQDMTDDELRGLQTGSQRHGFLNDAVTWMSVTGTTRSLLRPGAPSPEEVHKAIKQMPERLQEKFDRYVQSLQESDAPAQPDTEVSSPSTTVVKPSIQPTYQPSFATTLQAA